jgi:hypothetical protein
VPLYQAYGLRIDSVIELPELAPDSSGAAADIIFRKQRVDLSGDPRPDELGLQYPGVVSLRATAGKVVDVDVHADADARVVRLILLGPLLGLILHQRGFLVLHASAVEINSKAVAFIGEKGAGKSTTAAAFNAEGYALLADDVVAVAPKSHLVYPGFGQLKLWRETAEHLQSNASALPRLHPDLDKVGVRVPDRFSKTPRRLSRIYALTDGAEIAIQALRPQQAFMELVKNSYTLKLLEPTGSAQAHFRQAVDVAAKIPIRRLVRPRALASLSKIVAAVVADAA